MPTHPSHLEPDGDPDGTTRTRLPEGDPSARRPPVRTSRSLVTVVGVVVLLIAALAFATRGGSGSPGSADSGDTGTGAKAPDATATAPTGQRPVTGQTTGIATGFPHTGEGAQSAAANYAVALVSANILKPDQRHQIVQQLFTPDTTSALQAKLDAAYNTNFLAKLGLDPNGDAPQGQTYISRTVPIGTTTSAYSGDTATVQVWCTGLYGTAGVGSTKPVTSDWFTMTLGLRWTENDWKVDSFSQASGPAPIAGDNTASSADDITKAVEQYGGFTYAR
ncbi:hypothetical protein NGB36_29380 [Streptomyces sp. RB6PN25]|uniref:DUF8175 domain-containing protein n=1 Tax=Streptomyces humicola TaxID=2953240 RepID=A0ABT1Q732_9ACTN|nr:hypothetical protein [Streptomyces humicola]MCQ4084577.1 hypothetical protein [Streptomyces humicola]